MDKLWTKNVSMTKEIEKFTVGRDREMDLYLAKYDVLGSMAHITMLQSIDLLTADELKVLLKELKAIYQQAEKGEFVIEEGVEDVHSQVEMLLTRKLGDIGKKIHSGRSRNDQVLVDLKLFIRDQIKEIAGLVKNLFDELITQSERYKNVLMPGYTHLQVAMPSSFGLWLGAYAERLTDDLTLLHAAWEQADRNPLGAAAGYGSSAPLDRMLTTQLLGFSEPDYNAVSAMMGRGKLEWTVAVAYAGLAQTLGRFAADGCLFMSQNFGFIHLPDNLTTGSSIMSHKKNPDVFELVRAHCNRMQGIPAALQAILGNLPSGYFRDFQLTKEVYLPLFDEMDQVLDILDYAVCHMSVEKDLMSKPLYATAFTVETVNRLVAAGVPFREAYRQVGEAVLNGTFQPDPSLLGEDGKVTPASLGHCHIGSVGNLCNEAVATRMAAIVGRFPFARVQAALSALLQ